MHSRVPMREESQRGGTTLIGVWMCIAIIIALAFTFDLASALDRKASMANDLTAARDDTMSASFQMRAKNSESTGRAVADQAAATLRANGYSGEITVWFYEAPAADVPRSKRAYAWGMGMSEKSPALFGALFTGSDGWTVSNVALAHSVPFTAGTCWRPSDSGNGRYTYPAGAEVGTPAYERAATTADIPEEMRTELAQAVSEAKQQ